MGKSQKSKVKRGNENGFLSQKEKQGKGRLNQKGKGRLSQKVTMRESLSNVFKVKVKSRSSRERERGRERERERERERD